MKPTDAGRNKRINKKIKNKTNSNQKNDDQIGYKKLT
jgi:hypothetical protein